MNFWPKKPFQWEEKLIFFAKSVYVS
jgi:hypothetical protein